MSSFTCPLTAFFENKPFPASLDFGFVDVESFSRHTNQIQSNLCVMAIACRVLAKRLRDVCVLPESEPLWRAGHGFVIRDLPERARPRAQQRGQANRHRIDRRVQPSGHCSGRRRPHSAVNFVEDEAHYFNSTFKTPHSAFEMSLLTSAPTSWRI